MKEEISVQAEEAPRPRFRLKLDHDDVYFGCEEISQEEADAHLGVNDVVLDHAPDNAPGQYRWLREEKRFHALEKAQQKTVAGAPTLEQAFYDFVKNGELAHKTKAWCDWFEKTLDGKGS